MTGFEELTLEQCFVANKSETIRETIPESLALLKFESKLNESCLLLQKILMGQTIPVLKVPRRTTFNEGSKILDSANSPVILISLTRSNFEIAMPESQKVPY